MMRRFRDMGIWLQVQWDLFKRNQSGAQTLEYLGLALLIIGILAVGDSLTRGGDSFGAVLKQKFIDMVKGISTSSGGTGSGGTP